MYWGLATYTRNQRAHNKERTPVVRHLGERVFEAVPSGGNDAAFAVTLSTGEVAIMNYSSGDRRIIPTTTSPEHCNNDAPVITFLPPTLGVSHRI
ncbi:hypothetical protein B0H14DRAFT_2499319 [Mycena olivaceomarginata]|nr:hypothetical protein B0H14DRAFT_2499319 [Mycena olivaceomarginata]